MGSSNSWNNSNNRRRCRSSSRKPSGRKSSSGEGKACNSARCASGYQLRVSLGPAPQLAFPSPHPC